MLKNYFKIAWRNLMKNKVFSFINVFGLSIGLACCMLITIYLLYEFSYDKHHENGSNIFQVGTIFNLSEKDDRTAATPAPLAAALKREYPEVVECTRLLGTFLEDKTLLQYKPDNAGPRSFYETRGFLADSTFFRMFSYEFKEGNPSTALTQPLSVVISEEIASKLFGKEPALNKIIKISSSTNGDSTFTITGVFRQPVTPSHIDGRFFMSMLGGQMEGFAGRTDFAVNNMFFTYLQLKPGSNAKTLEQKLPDFIKKYAAADLKAVGFLKTQFLVPVKEIHFRSDIKGNVTPSGNVSYLYILVSVAIFTLLIACINFMNLSTARSSKRAAEVGVRKVLGAQKNSLVRQFLGESVLMSSIAFLFAIMITKLFITSFGQLTDKQLVFSFSQHSYLIAGFLALAIITGLIAGSYPAFYLSNFKPIRVLKGRFTNSLAAASFRKGLVVFQFIISAALIICSTVIARQMHYMQTKDLGFVSDKQIIISLRSQNAKNIYRSFKNELSRQPGIASIGASFYYPGIFNPSDMAFYREGQNVKDAKLTRMNGVDANFLQTLGIKPVAGRIFSEQHPGDTSGRLVMNEEAIRKIGYTPEQSIGKEVLFDWEGRTLRFEIIGVVKDFHFEDLHLPITPYGLQLNNTDNFNYLIVRLNSGDVEKQISSISSAWRKLNSNEPFEYNFLDEEFNKNYRAEKRLGSMVTWFTLIAIVISCLGLFGLAAFSAEQRTKEIGVRKVLGATVTNIFVLLSKDFLKLVVIAIFLAAPIAWYVMNKWLQDFAYRIPITAWIFILAGIIAVMIALVTVSFQAIKAATANPVKNLRTE